MVEPQIGNDGAMRTLGRRAAIGATTVALLAAATGTSLAALRGARYESEVVSTDLAQPAPRDERGGSASSLAPSAGPSPDGASKPRPGADASAPATPGGPAPDSPPRPAPGQSDPAAGAADPAASSGGAGGEPGPGVDESGTDPASGRRSPSDRPPAASSCAGDEASGALPVRHGRLEAVGFTLPWPGLGPLVMVPQASAARARGAPVRIVRSSLGALATDGQSLTVVAPTPIEYMLEAGKESAEGSIRFTAVGPTAQLSRQGCRDRRFTLYDVGRGSLDGSPLRIVGVVGPAGMVTIDEDGGAARVTSSLPGVHAVTLLTASDAGAPGPLVNVVATVG